MMNMTDHNNLFKQMMDYQMNLMNNSLNAMGLFQSRSEKAMELFTNQMNWATEKWKGAIVDWNKACQTGAENFKKVVEDNLSKIQSSKE
ncbi:MAG: hypothetical protein BWK80_16615 [Desulfobacteraceae bacterium IS3]|nr:MAG: hypothetical protein BWK80_16615 [Desulfobacteraceae bacterium IS3]